MKILVVSLLRLGDLVMQTPSLSALRKLYPRAEIHLLTNDSNKGIVPLLPFIQKTHYFPRQLLQLSQGEIQIPTLWGHNHLQSFMAEVNANNYTYVINLTHNKLSGHLMDLIKASDKEGLVIAANQRPTFGSRWFRYLNNISTTYSRHKFHLSDVYQWSTSAQENEPAYLVPTVEGEAEAAEILKNLSDKKPILALQTQTSDAKKNWRATHWMTLIRNVLKHQPGYQIVMLGSPAEKPELEKIKALLGEQQDSVRIVTPQLAGAFSLLKRTKYLISVDTSIKHMGAAAGAKIIELALGSSDLQSTGAYTDGAYIIKSKEACSPCHHSSICHREQHLCSATVSPQLVYGIFSALVNADITGIQHLAQEFSEQAEVFVTSMGGEFWTVNKLSHENYAVERAVELTAWKHLFTTSDRHNIDTYGSLGYKLGVQMKKENLTSSNLSEGEERLRKEQSLVLSLKLHIEREFKTATGSAQIFKSRILDRLIEAENILQSGPIFSYLINEKNEDSFSLARALITQATDTLDLYQVQNRIIRNFDTSMEAE